MNSDPLLAFSRLFLLGAWTLGLLPFYLPARFLRLGVCAFKRFYWRGVCVIAGIELAVHGELARKHPVLFAANHASYLDVPVLGALLPALFAAKQDVAGWPFVGFLARIGDALFVDRKSSQARNFANLLAGRLKKGASVVFFPEATSSDGLRVLAFRTAGFQAALTAKTLVQPVSIAFTGLDGMPICRAWRPLFSWYGDMEMVPHLWAFLGLGKTRAEVVLHPAVPAADFENRQSLALHCERASARGVSCLLTGALQVEEGLAGRLEPELAGIG
jgi:1-acyl-sn-glycerol-3-phosphate acyltransferase